MSTRPSKSMPGPAKADAMVKELFDKVAGEPTPDHLVELANELEQARRDGRLKAPSKAA